LGAVVLEVEVLEALAEAVVAVEPLWFKSTFTYMSHHQNKKKFANVQTSQSPKLKSTIKSFSLKHHHLLPTKLHLFPSNHKTKKRPWFTFWLRNQMTNKILSFQLLHPLNHPNQKFTSSNTRHKRNPVVHLLVDMLKAALLVALPKVALLVASHKPMRLAVATKLAVVMLADIPAVAVLAVIFNHLHPVMAFPENPDVIKQRTKAIDSINQ